MSTDDLDRDMLEFILRPAVEHRCRTLPSGLVLQIFPLAGQRARVAIGHTEWVYEHFW